MSGARRRSSQRRQAEKWGRLAEILSALSLRLRGYRILARGYRTHHGEIDIIARRGRVVAFIEVKARTDGQAAAMAITPKQQRRIAATALYFMQRQPRLSACDWRFDAMLVNPWRLPHHIVDAWRPME